MKFYIKDHLTLDEQIQEWYACSKPELNRLAKYLDERTGQQVAEAFDKGYEEAKEIYGSH